MPDDDQMELDWSRYDRAQFGAVLPDDPKTKDRAQNVRTRLQAVMSSDPGWW